MKCPKCVLLNPKFYLNYDFEIIHKEKIAIKTKKHSSSSWLNTFLHFANSQYSDNGYIKKRTCRFRVWEAGT